MFSKCRAIKRAVRMWGSSYPLHLEGNQVRSSFQMNCVISNRVFFLPTQYYVGISMPAHGSDRLNSASAISASWSWQTNPLFTHFHLSNHSKRWHFWNLRKIYSSNLSSDIKFISVQPLSNARVSVNEFSSDKKFHEFISFISSSSRKVLSALEENPPKFH